MKKCNTCKETKDFSEFSKRKDSKDGLQCRCKACNKQTNKRYRDNNKDYFAKYRQDNKDYYAELNKQRILSAIPCVYRIQSKTSGLYYIGSTTAPLCDRVSNHFSKRTCIESPFTGKDKSNWEIQQLCTGTKEEVRELEKYLLSTRVNDDIKCLNRRIG